MVVVDMIYVGLFGIRRDDDKGNAWAIAEEVEGLNGTGIEIPATFIGCDDDRRRGPLW